MIVQNKLKVSSSLINNRSEPMRQHNSYFREQESYLLFFRELKVSILRDMHATLAFLPFSLDARRC